MNHHLLNSSTFLRKEMKRYGRKEHFTLLIAKVICLGIVN